MGLSEWVTWEGVSSPPLTGMQTEIPDSASELPSLTERSYWEVFGISYNTVALKLGLGAGVKKRLKFFF